MPGIIPKRTENLKVNANRHAYKADIERAKGSMPKDDFLDLWENRNDQLRNLGRKLVPVE